MAGNWKNTQEFANIQSYAQNLKQYGDLTDQIYGDVLGLGPAGDIITNFAGQESHYGYGLQPDATHTMGLTQIDPIRYQDLLTDYNFIDPKTGAHSSYYDRINKINAYMQGMEGYEDWDMTKLATIGEDGKYSGFSKYKNDILSNYMLTRMMFMKDPDDLPVGIEQEKGWWDSFWNKNPAQHTGPDAYETKFLNFIQPNNTVNEVINSANPLDGTLLK